MGGQNVIVNLAQRMCQNSTFFSNLSCLCLTQAKKNNNNPRRKDSDNALGIRGAILICFHHKFNFEPFLFSLKCTRSLIIACCCHLFFLVNFQMGKGDFSIHQIKRRLGKGIEKP